LALLFALIVAAAIAIVYLYVVPGQLHSSLQNQKIAGLLDDGRTFQAQLSERLSDGTNVSYTISAIASATGDRVTLLAVNGRGGLYQRLDSGTPATTLKFAIAQDALRRNVPVTGTERGPTGLFAEAALPVAVRDTNDRPVLAYVVVYSASLAGVDSNVSLI